VQEDDISMDSLDPDPPCFVESNVAPHVFAGSRIAAKK
jgi:hypothetical protein